MNKTEFTANSFTEFLRSNISNENLRDLVQIIDYFNASQGGCSCSRGRRTQAFYDIYNNKIININISVVEEIKKITNSSEIIFKNEANAIIKQF